MHDLEKTSDELEKIVTDLINVPKLPKATIGVTRITSYSAQLQEPILMIRLTWENIQLPQGFSIDEIELQVSKKLPNAAIITALALATADSKGKKAAIVFGVIAGVMTIWAYLSSFAEFP